MLKKDNIKKNAVFFEVQLQEHDIMERSSIPSEKSGYLKEDFRLFHIKDQTPKEYKYHYHDFHKVIVFLSGKVSYHIEGKTYHLNPWDILLVSRGAIHKPEIDFSLPYERFILWIRGGYPRTASERLLPGSRRPEFQSLSVWTPACRNISRIFFLNWRMR